jgi:Pentapeptide repeats (8 copies)
MTTQLNENHPTNNLSSNPITIAIISAVLGLSTGILGTIATQHIKVRFEIEPRIVAAQSLLGEKDKFPAGVTAMEGIIREAPDRQWQIVEILATKIREKAKAPVKDKLNSSNVQPVPEGIKAALKLIKKRKVENDTKASDYGDGSIDLLASNFKGTDLNNANLSNASLDISYLYMIDVKNANLRKTSLKGAYLRGATINGSDLEGANLTGYPGDTANTFIYADLIGTKLVDTNLNKADLTGAKFFHANLKESEMKKARINATKKIKQACNWHLATYSQEISSLLNQSNESDELEQRNACKKFIHTQNSSENVFEKGATR